jgi:hypothetical protein
VKASSFIMRWNVLPAAALMATATTMAQAAPAKIRARDGGDGNFNGIYGFSDALADYYSRVSRHIENTNRNSPPVCDLSSINLPAQASGLPAVPAGQNLVDIAIGRGTQVCLPLRIAVIYF